MGVLLSFLDPVFVISLLGLGALAGFLAGLLGIGGGVVLVPGLYVVFLILGVDPDLIMHMAVGTSLAIIIPTGMSSAWSHYKRGAVDGEAVKKLAPSIIMGVALGVWLASSFSGDTLRGVFAFAIVMLAVIMIIDPAKYNYNLSAISSPLFILAGFIIGCVSSLIGIGGATLSVPFLSFCKKPIHRAIGTASVLGLFVAMPATLGFVLTGLSTLARPEFSFGYVYVPAWLLVILSSVCTAPLGALITHKVKKDRLRKVFAGFMILVALKMILEVA